MKIDIDNIKKQIGRGLSKIEHKYNTNIFEISYHNNGGGLSKGFYFRIENIDTGEICWRWNANNILYTQNHYPGLKDIDILENEYQNFLREQKLKRILK